MQTRKVGINEDVVKVMEIKLGDGTISKVRRHAEASARIFPIFATRAQMRCRHSPVDLCLHVKVYLHLHVHCLLLIRAH